MLEENKNFDLLKNGRARVVPHFPPGYDMVVINFKEPPFDKPQVPQAVSWPSIGGNGQGGHPGIRGANRSRHSAHEAVAVAQGQVDAFYKPDLDKGQESAGRAGLPNGFKTKLSVVPTYPPWWPGAGDSSQPQARGHRRGDRERRVRDLDQTLGRQAVRDDHEHHGGSADPDAPSTSAALQGADPSNFFDPEMDRLLDQGKATFDFNKRRPSTIRFR